MSNDGSACESESENGEELFHDSSLPAGLSNARKSPVFVPRTEKDEIFVLRAEQPVRSALGTLPNYFKSALCALPKYSPLNKNLNVPCGCARNATSGPSMTTLPSPTDASAIAVPPFRYC
jgi:hypothetical protein